MSSAIVFNPHLVIQGKPLQDKHRDHGLSGKWKGYRDCHIKPDLVLIYKKSATVLSLVRLGSHAELFG